MSKVAYVRVSTAEQNEARQREALAVRGIDKWFIEKASGKNTDRPEFQKMLDWVREGDTIYIHDLSRIARSTKDLLDLLDVLREKGVALVSGKESIGTSTATGKLLVTMVAAINESARPPLRENWEFLGLRWIDYFLNMITTKSGLNIIFSSDIL